MGKIIDLVGQKFDRLTVVSFSHSDNGAHWNCVCDCGGNIISKGCHLRSPARSSCGCLRKESIKKASAASLTKRVIGLKHPRILKDLYRNMKDRCYNPDNKRWKNYGGRGIKVCDEWLNDHRSFYWWCEENGHNKGLQIDRIDVNGDYKPSNCRFVNAQTQMNNTTQNRYVEAFGEKLTLAEAARKYHITYGCLKHRLDRGMDSDQALTKKPRVVNR